jgi:hypothetical protein
MLQVSTVTLEITTTLATTNLYLEFLRKSSELSWVQTLTMKTLRVFIMILLKKFGL